MNYTTETFEAGSEFRVTTWEIIPAKNRYSDPGTRKTHSEIFTTLEEATAYADTLHVESDCTWEEISSKLNENLPVLRDKQVMVRQPGNKNFTSIYWAKTV